MKKILLLFAIALLFASGRLFAQDLTISGGNNVSTMICSDGSVFAWGQNKMGVGTTVRGGLGTGNTTDDVVYTPQKVVLPPSMPVSMVDAGSGSHFVALTCDGQVFCWGNNQNGQVGNTGVTSTVVTTPTLVMAGETNSGSPTSNLTGVSFVSGGNDENYAITDDGRVIGWGQNDVGQLGNGNTVDQDLPVYARLNASTYLEDVVQVEAGDQSGYALTSDGRVYSWGDNTSGQLGQAAALGIGGSTPYAALVTFDDGTPLQNIVKVSAGDNTCFALDDQGNVWAWGNGGWGGLTGQGFTQTHADPRRVVGGETGETFLKAIAIAGGQGFAMAVTADGYGVAWGNNGGTNGSGGNLGDGTSVNSSSPVYIDDASGNPIGGMINISDGDYWGFLTDSLNQIWVWGGNDVGQLGVGSSVVLSDHAILLSVPGCGVPDPRPRASLPDDVFVCAGTPVTLNANFPNVNNHYEYDWYRNGTFLRTTTVDRLRVREDGTFKVVVRFLESVGSSPCGYDPAEDEMVITYYEPEFTIPTNLKFCPPNFSVRVDGEGTYNYYPTETSNSLLGTSYQDQPTSFDYNLVTDNDGETFHVWVEEQGNRAGTVVFNTPPTTGTGQTTQEYNAGFMVYEDIVIDSISFIISPYSAPLVPDDWVVQVFGGQPYNGNNVADRTNVLGQSLPYSVMVDTVCTQFSGCTARPTLVTMPVNIALSGSPTGEAYWIGFRDFPQPVLDFTMRTNFVDDIDGQVVHVTSTDIQRNVSTTKFGPIFNWQFHTAQHFCDRFEVEVTIDEGCSCKKAKFTDLVVTDAGADTVICRGEVVNIGPVLNGSTISSQTAIDSIAFAYYKSAIDDTTASNRLELDSMYVDGYRVTNAEVGVYTLVMYDYFNPTDVMCRVEHQIQIDSAKPPTYSFTDVPEVCEGTALNDVTLTIFGTPAVDFDIEDQLGNSYTATAIPTGGPLGDSVFTVNGLPTDAGTYVLNLTTVSDQWCDGFPTADSALTLTINATPDVTVTLPVGESSVQICESVTAYDMSQHFTDPSASSFPKLSGTYSTNAPTGSINATNGEFYPPTSHYGQFEVYYTFVSTTGCEDIDTIPVQIHETPNVYFTLPATICSTSDAVALVAREYSNTNIGSGSVTWEISNGTTTTPITTGEFDPSAYTANADYTITLNYTSVGGCIGTASESTEIIELDLPVVQSRTENIQSVADLLAMTAQGESGATISWYYPDILTPSVLTETPTTGISEYLSPEASALNDGDIYGDDTTFTYLVRQSLNGCESEPVEVTTIISNCPLDAPTIANTFMCIGSSNIPQFAVTSTVIGTINWLDATQQSMGSGTSKTPTVDFNTAGVNTFYAYETHPTLGCDGPPATITLTVRDTPNVNLNLAKLNYCIDDAVNLFTPDDYSIASTTITGTGFTKTASGIEFNPAHTPNTSSTSTLVYTYTETANSLSCSTTLEQEVSVTYAPPVTSLGNKVLNTTYPAPPALSIVETPVGTVSWLNASGTEIVAAAGLSSWNVSNLPATGSLYNIATYDYSVLQVVNGCRSIPSPLTLEVYDCPTAAPAALPRDVCEGLLVPDLIATSNTIGGNANNIGWFTNIASIGVGNELGGSRTDIYTTGVTAPGTYTYYISEYDPVAQCYGPYSTATLQINAPTDVEITVQDTFCMGSGLQQIPVTLTNSNPSTGFVQGGRVVGTQLNTNAIGTPATETVSLVYNYTNSFGCESSDSKDVVLLYVPKPTTQGSFLVQDLTNPTTADPLQATLTDAQATLLWYNYQAPNAKLNNDGLDFYQSPLTALGTFDYLVSQFRPTSFGGCESQKEIAQLIITDCPVGRVQVTNPLHSICTGNTPPQLEATLLPWTMSSPDEDGDETVHWYDHSPNSTEAGAVGQIYSNYSLNVNIPNAPNGKTYYARAYDPDNNCYGPPSTAVVVVNRTDPPFTVNPASICEGDGPVILQISGTPAGTVTWYEADQTTTIPTNAQGQATVTNASSLAFGSYSYYVSQTANGCPSVLSSAVTLIVKEVPDAPDVQDNIACKFRPNMLIEDYEISILNPNTTAEINWLSASGQDLNSRKVVGTLGTIKLRSNDITSENTTVRAFYTLNGCSSEEGSAVFTQVQNPPKPGLMGDTTAVCIGVSSAKPLRAYPNSLNLNPIFNWKVGNDIALDTSAYTIETSTYDEAGLVPIQLVEVKVQGGLTCPSDTFRVQLPIMPVPVPHILTDAEYTYGDSIIACKAELPIVLRATDSSSADITSFRFSEIKYGLNPITVQNELIFLEPRNSGVDYLTLTAKSEFCTDSVTVPIWVVSPPETYFTWFSNSGTATTSFYNGSVQEEIDSLGTPLVDYQLYFQKPFDTIFAGEFTEPAEKAFEYGDHIVRLYGINEYGCASEFIDTIFMNITSGLYVPSAFAPDVSGEAGLFLPKGHNLKEYKLYIFDSWGNMVFFTDVLNPENGSPREPWTGLDINGNPLKSDYYMWKIEATFKNGNKWKGQASGYNTKKKIYGNVFLIR